MKLRRRNRYEQPPHELETLDVTAVMLEAARRLGIEQRTPNPKAKAAPVRKAA